MKEKKNNQNNQESIKSIYNVDDGLEYCIASTPEFGILKSLGIVEDAVVSKKKTYKLGGPVLLMVEFK